MNVIQRFMEEESADRTAISLSKPDLKAAIDAASAWYTDATSSYNSALPEPARTALDHRQKAYILMHIILGDLNNGNG